MRWRPRSACRCRPGCCPPLCWHRHRAKRRKTEPPAISVSSPPRVSSDMEKASPYRLLDRPLLVSVSSPPRAWSGATRRHRREGIVDATSDQVVIAAAAAAIHDASVAVEEIQARIHRRTSGRHRRWRDRVSRTRRQRGRLYRQGSRAHRSRRRRRHECRLPWCERRHRERYAG